MSAVSCLPIIGRNVNVVFQVQAVDQTDKVKANLMSDGGTSLKVREPAVQNWFP